MSSFSLKVIAAVTMLVDHVGFLFFPGVMWFRVVGRISLPIFAFLIGEGYLKTRDVKKYLFRLALFALISYIPHALFLKAGNFPYPNLNIFFTLTAGLLGLIAFTRLPFLAGITSLFGLAALAEFFRFDYGAYAVLLISAYYGFREHRTSSLITVFILTALSVFYKIPPGTSFIQFFSLLALFPIFFYNGTLGMRFYPQWFYWFYPVHLLILALIKFNI